jgi:hypothetical protein
MASISVKCPKTCRNKKSVVYLTTPASSSTCSLSSCSDGIKVSNSQPKRKQRSSHYRVRSAKVLVFAPKRKKLSHKKFPPSLSSSCSDSELSKFNNECRQTRTKCIANEEDEASYENDEILSEVVSSKIYIFVGL